ncbi:TetR/AcrR family transcriptional regulator [Succinatimonas hippei]|uniref:TetR/AcrR family transcriptional regulator n=1 Tax=Succinatimonas hippei TaxID=626938 RepID=UPI0025A36CFD|nr:TetR/AcrR family transcriptional regulator [Succinatimonas hippei]MDM8119588.1 TetR/AcrR family transcriptional regulator [Succinatimonas hippei]
MAESKRVRRKDARPGEILEAAIDIFLNNGFNQTTLLDIAKKAGISRSTIYLYYKTKEDLFLQVVRTTIHKHSAQIQKINAQSNEDLRQNIHNIVELVFTTTGDQNYLRLLLIFITESANNPFLQQIFFTEIVSKITNPAKELFKSTKETKEICDVILAMIAGSFFISSLSTMILTKKGNFLPSRQTLKEMLPKLILNSLSKAPSPDAKE